MSFAVSYARASIGIRAPLVTVETHITNGLPAFHIVGLPETAVKESKERVRSALLNAQFEFPDQRITVNLAPADLPKSGGRFDLAIAIGILAASAQINKEKLHEYEFAGELALSGTIRPIAGALSVAMGAQQADRILILSPGNAFEAALANSKGIYPADHLLSVCAHLNGTRILPPHPQADFQLKNRGSIKNLSSVVGQEHARFALEIAASGGHNLLFHGTPGAGKTLMSECMPGILPTLSEEQALEVGAIRSLCGQTIDLEHWFTPPFRAPHHSASTAALVGGGNPPKPGEISLAHQGVLFLDELPEFRRDALEALREPLESGSITIARANAQEKFPANFQLLAAMNSCPCGYYGCTQPSCRCSPQQIQRYQRKVSGPLLDRIDLNVNVTPLSKQQLLNTPIALPESSEKVRERTEKAQKIQMERCGKLNNRLTRDEILHYCTVDPATQNLLENAIDRLHLSARAYQRLLKLARTIADIQEEANIQESHIAQALSFRQTSQICAKA